MKNYKVELKLLEGKCIDKSHNDENKCICKGNRTVEQNKRNNLREDSGCKKYSIYNYIETVLKDDINLFLIRRLAGKLRMVRTNPKRIQTKFNIGKGRLYFKKNEEKEKKKEIVYNI